MPETWGIGVDLCAVSRMARAIEKAHFFTRVFTENERAYLQSRGRAVGQSAAAMFAAKEAVAKALGTGFAQGVMPWQIEVTHADSGQPGTADRAAQARLEQMGGGRILLSLSPKGIPRLRSR
ncbi:MAG: holo-ACP synthase [Christensenellales bacterium]